MVLAPGSVVDEPVVEDGRIVAGKVLWLNCAFDHRVVDGTHIAEIAAVLIRVLGDPEAEPSAAVADDRRRLAG